MIHYTHATIGDIKHSLEVHYSLNTGYVFTINSVRNGNVEYRNVLTKDDSIRIQQEIWDKVKAMSFEDLSNTHLNQLKNEMDKS